MMLDEYIEDVDMDLVSNTYAKIMEITRILDAISHGENFMIFKCQ